MSEDQSSSGLNIDRMQSTDPPIVHPIREDEEEISEDWDQNKGFPHLAKFILCLFGLYCFTMDYYGFYGLIDMLAETFQTVH